VAEWLEELPDWQGTQVYEMEPKPASAERESQPESGPVCPSEELAEPPASGDLETMTRPQLVRLAISLGLKGSGTDDELRLRIRIRLAGGVA
jgi:hypothetical protein